VLWSPAFFGVKPDLIIKGRLDRGSPDGRSQCIDPDATARALPADVCSLRQVADGVLGHIHLKSRGHGPVSPASSASAKKLYAVQNTRGKISKKSMIHNDAHAQDRGRSRNL